MWIINDDMRNMPAMNVNESFNFVKLGPARGAQFLYYISTLNIGRKDVKDSIQLFEGIFTTFKKVVSFTTIKFTALVNYIKAMFFKTYSF